VDYLNPYIYTRITETLIQYEYSLLFHRSLLFLKGMKVIFIQFPWFIVSLDRLHIINRKAVYKIVQTKLPTSFTWKE
jgi:hypothetical protein